MFREILQRNICLSPPPAGTTACNQAHFKETYIDPFSLTRKGKWSFGKLWRQLNLVSLGCIAIISLAEFKQTLL